MIIHVLVTCRLSYCYSMTFSLEDIVESSISPKNAAALTSRLEHISPML